MAFLLRTKIMNLSDFEVDINNKKIHFERNNKLKPTGCRIPWTEDHIKEYSRCASDYQYFIEKYCRVLTERGMQIVALREYQQRILDNFHNNRYNVLLAPRQSGKTTSIQLYLLWFILFSEHKKCAILAHKGRAARKILRDIKKSYEYLPKFLQQGIKVWNASYIELENGCSIIADTTSKSGLSGDSINVLYIDEVALIPQNLFWDFYDSNFPTLSSFENSKIFLSSTAKGLNHWYKLWTDAIQGRNGYNSIRVKWQEVPGRTEEWKQNEIAKTSLISFNQEQECSFLGSALTLIEGTHLSNLTFKDPIELPFDFPMDERYVKSTSIYEPLRADHIYTLGLDSSEMQEDSTSDSISIQILDITTFPFVQVGSILIRDGISYLEVPELIVRLGYYYNTGFIFIEANSTGLEIANIIRDEFQYENLYCQKENSTGFKTTKATKKLGCSNLKLLVENQRLIINDFNTISQLGVFVKSRTTYKADKTYKDDAVMGLLAAIFFMQDKSFDNIPQMNYLTGEVTTQPENNTPIPIIAHDSIDTEEAPDTDWSWMLESYCVRT
jgi:hypothetical protein